MNFWYEDYKNLNLLKGEIKFILHDDEDMIEIRYKDGMLIDVGYIKKDNSYYITIVSTDDESGWNKPLDVIEIKSKKHLFDKIQETIYKYRKSR